MQNSVHFCMSEIWIFRNPPFGLDFDPYQCSKKAGSPWKLLTQQPWLIWFDLNDKEIKVPKRETERERQNTDIQVDYWCFRNFDPKHIQVLFRTFPSEKASVLKNFLFGKKIDFLHCRNFCCWKKNIVDNAKVRGRSLWTLQELLFLIWSVECRVRRFVGFEKMEIPEQRWRLMRRCEVV